MEIKKYSSRNWAVFDDDGSLVCVTVYKKGAIEVVRRLSNHCNALSCCDNTTPCCKLKTQTNPNEPQKDFSEIVRQLKFIESMPIKATL